MAGIIEGTLHTENVFYCSGLNRLVSWKLRCWYQRRDIQAIASGNSQRLEVYGCKFIFSFVLQFIFFLQSWMFCIEFWHSFLLLIFFSILNLKGVKNLLLILSNRPLKRGIPEVKFTRNRILTCYKLKHLNKKYFLSQSCTFIRLHLHTFVDFASFVEFTKWKTKLEKDMHLHFSWVFSFWN